MAHFSRGALAAVSLLVVAAHWSHAATFYTINVQGMQNLRLLDPSTGITTPTAPAQGLGPGSWNGLADRPGDYDFLYAVNNPRPIVFEDPQTSRLARIDRHGGNTLLMPPFDEEVLGFAEPFATAIAISPADKSKAYVAGFAARVAGARYIWQVNLASGAVLAPAVPVQDGALIRCMTITPDGTQIVGIDDAMRLVRVDPDTGGLTELGETGLTFDVEGLVFNPYTGRLFAIEAGLHDRLVELDPQNGHLLHVIGSVGIEGPEGLVVVPQAGDADGDADVDLTDFAIVKAYLGHGNALHQGDFNRDFRVDQADFLILRAHFASGVVAATPVSEPASWLLAVVSIPSALVWGSRGPFSFLVGSPRRGSPPISRAIIPGLLVAAHGQHVRQSCRVAPPAARRTGPRNGQAW